MPVMVPAASSSSNAAGDQVLQPGATTPTVFLNITSKVQSGGEQGLLGLAFHPLYESNGRFFVFYTNSGGDLVVADTACPPATRTSPISRKRSCSRFRTLRPRITTAACSRLGRTLSVYRRRGRRRRQRPAEQRAEPERAAGQDFAPRHRCAGGPDVRLAANESIRQRGRCARRDLRVWHAQSVAVQFRSRLRRAVGGGRRSGRARGSQHAGRHPRQLRLADLGGLRVHEQRSVAVRIAGGLQLPCLRLRAHRRPVFDHGRLRLSRIAGRPG